MAIQDQLLKIILPHFESSQQRQGQDACELSLEASATELRTNISALELTAGVQRLKLKEKDDDSLSEFEEAIGNILVSFIDATVSAESTSDLQDSIDRVLSLIAAFGMSYSTDVADIIVARALEFSDVLLERVRGHACLLLGKIAATLMKSREDKKVDDEWIEEQLVALEEALTPRLQDKAQSVRSHAIKAAGAFFLTAEDVDTYEDLLDALIWNMAHDPSVSCRIVAVQSVPVNATTMDSLIARVRDIKSKVRAEALQVLCNNSQAVTEMSESQFVELIRSGLTKRCGGTKKAASKMICSGWMKNVKYDPIALLKIIGVLDNEEEATMVLDVVMDAAREEDSSYLDDLSEPEIRAYKSGIQNAALPLQNSDEELKPEQLFFLKARCKNVMASKGLTSAQKDAITTKLIPEVPLLCELFESHARSLIAAIDQNEEEKEDSECFVCLQLLQLAEVADLQEEGSRRHFAHVMRKVLAAVETPDDLVEGSINALRLACDNETEMIDAVSGIIGKVGHWPVGEDDGKGNTGGDDMKNIKLVRILSVLTVFLETATSHFSSNPAVKDFAKYIVPAATHDDSMVREAAIGCFGKLGLFTDEETLISEFKPHLLKVASCDDEKIEIRAQALLALADWSMLFSDTLTPYNDGDNTLCFSDIVREMMDDSRISAVCISAEVAAKLLFSGRVCESEWFAKLITIFFDPRLSDMKEDDEDIKEVGSPVRLQQLLTLFFPAICFKEDGDSRDAMMGCILPLLELVYLKAPSKLNTTGKKSKRKVAWPIAKMISYICSTVDTGRPDDDAATVVQTNTHDEAEDPRNTTAFVSVAPTVAVDTSSTSILASLSIAEFLVKNIEASLNDTETRALCKILGAAGFDEKEEDNKSLFTLKRLMEELGMILTDATSLKYIADLNEILSEINVDDEEEDDDLTEGGSPKSAAGTPPEHEGEVGSDEDSVVHVVGLNLSEDLMKSLDDLKIGDSDSDEEFGIDKENSSKAKRNSTGKRHSAGSAASRRSRVRRLAATN